MAADHAASLIVKPAGEACNLECAYCFYRGHGPQRQPGMSLDLLRIVLQQAVEACGPGVPVCFQGGEPTLMGVEFFEAAREMAPRAALSIQTNGILLDAAWVKAFRGGGWLVGLSVDGPADLHDVYRVGRDGSGSHAQAARAARLLREAGVDWAALVTVHRANQDHGRRVWRHVVGDLGAQVVQFIPVVDRGGAMGCTREGYAAFLREAGAEWNAGGRAVWARPFSDLVEPGSGCCVCHEVCGTVPVVERDGAVYACDHYVAPWHRLGSVLDRHLGEMIASRKLAAFGRRKRDDLAAECRSCPSLARCWGGCPRERIGPGRQSHACLGTLAAIAASGPTAGPGPCAHAPETL